MTRDSTSWISKSIQPRHNWVSPPEEEGWDEDPEVQVTRGDSGENQVWCLWYRKIYQRKTEGEKIYLRCDSFPRKISHHVLEFSTGNTSTLISRYGQREPGWSSIEFNSQCRFMFRSDLSFFRYSFFISSLRASISCALLLLAGAFLIWFFNDWYCSAFLNIKLNSTSEIKPSFNAFETSLLIEICFASARATVCSCFEIFLSNLLPPTVKTFDTKPKKPATPAKGSSATAPIPLRETATPPADNIAAVNLVKADVEWVTAFSLFVFLQNMPVMRNFIFEMFLTITNLFQSSVEERLVMYFDQTFSMWQSNNFQHKF